MQAALPRARGLSAARTRDPKRWAPPPATPVELLLRLGRQVSAETLPTGWEEARGAGEHVGLDLDGIRHPLTFWPHFQPFGAESAICGGFECNENAFWEPWVNRRK